MNAREPAGAALGEPLATAAAARRGWRAWLAWALAFAILGGTWRSADMRPLDLLAESANMGEFARGFFPPTSPNGGTTRARWA